MTERAREIASRRFASLPELRERWTGGLRPSPIVDRTEVESAIRDAYMAHGLATPATVLWLRSPRAAAIASILWETARSLSQSRYGAGDLPRIAAPRLAEAQAELERTLSANTRERLERELGAPVQRAVTHHLLEPVRDALREELLQSMLGADADLAIRHPSLERDREPSARATPEPPEAEVAAIELLGGMITGWRDPVWEEAWGDLRSQASRQHARFLNAARRRLSPVSPPRQQARANPLIVRAHRVVSALVERAALGAMNLGRSAVLDFCAETPGLELAGAAASLGRVTSLVGLWWPFRTCAIVSERQVRIERDGEGRLHAESGPALAHPDGWAIWSWHGLRVPREAIEEPVTVERILAERNVELRRVFLERFGLARFLETGGGELIHADRCGQLFEIDTGDREPVMVVRVKNSTPEPDGHFKHYVLRVPPAMETARQAVAWTFDQRPEDYAPEVET